MVTGMCDTSGSKKKSKKVAKKKAKKTTGKKAQGRVTTQVINNLTGKKDQPEVEEKKLGEGHYEQPTANVGFSMGFTLPTNNAYESVRVEASLHMPCYAGEINKVQPLVQDLVENWLGEAVTNVKIKLGMIETPGDQPEPKAPDTSPEAQGSAKSDIPPWDTTDSSETPQTTAPEASDEVPDDARTDASLFDELGIE